MFQSWRFKVQEASRAFRQGRLERASQLICQADLQQYQPGQRLASNVATGLIDRARRYLNGGDTTTAWRDLDAAKALRLDPVPTVNVQRSLVDCTLKQVKQLLENNEVDSAIEWLNELKRRQIPSKRVNSFCVTAQRMDAARRFSRQGRFDDAQSELTAAFRLFPAASILDQRDCCQQNGITFRQLTRQLYKALSKDDWKTSSDLANQLLELAPDCQLARDARRRAEYKLKEEEVKIIDKATGLADTQHWSPKGKKSHSVTKNNPSGILDTAVMKPSQPRFLLWVDGVGGYMVCLADQVTIGQAVPDSNVDIPVLGDLSREQACLRRQGEDYLVEPIGQVGVQGKPIDRPTMLSDGDSIELASGVVLRFRQPHPLSATARLEIVSQHRTQPWVDSVLLMGESCVLGPSWSNHVVCRDWTHDVVLFRHGTQLFCRGAQDLEIDGRSCAGVGPLTYNSHVSGEEFSMSLEELK